MPKQAAAKRPSTDEYLRLVTPQPPSGALINAILEHADVRHDLGEGRVLLRLSRRGIRKAAIRRRLGREATRLEEVSLVWDDEAGQIVRVCDDAESSGQVDWAEPSESDRFELTEAGLAYLANFEAEWRP
ncbi:MAG TPA: hypothetical protein VN694_15255 [Caulobacteraceae bacterium]|nr:hypothetical protein [Caulobacteraceae bacterium]